VAEVARQTGNDMSKKSKRILIIGIVALVTAFSIVGGYWAGYSAGNSAGWISGNVTGKDESFKKAYDEGHDIGFKDGKKDAFAQGQAKGIEDAKRYIIEHTKGRIKWPDQ
jgi:hypothetical protein